MDPRWDNWEIIGTTEEKNRILSTQPHIWRTRFFLASILYTHIEYHKSPILTDNQQNLMKSFQETVERAFSGSLLAPNMEHQIFSGLHTLHTHIKYHKSPILTENYQNLKKSFQETVERAFLGSPMAPYLENQIFSGLHTLHTHRVP